MILVADKKILREIKNAVYVTSKTLKNYQGNISVEIILATRAVAIAAQGISLPGLKFVQLLSAGYDGVDVSYFKKQNIVICNAGDVYAVSMAEYVVYSILMVTKRYNKGINNPLLRFGRGYKWITELKGKCVGIIGCGAIGSAVAKRLFGFDVIILGYDPFCTTCDCVEKIYNKFDDFLPQCDYLVLAVPYNDATQGMVNAKFLSMCKRNTTLINVGRKELINNTDFLNCLKNNKEMSAVLDIFEIFPNPITNPYRRLSNVKVLPGVTAISQEVTQRRIQLVKENISRFVNNEKLLFML